MEKTTNEPQRLFTEAEAAKFLTISQRTFRRLVRNRNVNKVRLGPMTVRYRRSDLERIAGQGGDQGDAR